jgi:hypothetical protein
MTYDIETRDWGQPERPRHMEPMRSVVLEKVAGGTNEVPTGTVFQYTYKSQDRNHALTSATKALIRQWSAENRLNWKVVE